MSVAARSPVQFRRAAGRAGRGRAACRGCHWRASHRAGRARRRCRRRRWVRYRRVIRAVPGRGSPRRGWCRRPHGSGHQAQRGDGQVAGVAWPGEHGHVAPLDRAVHRSLQGWQVGDVDVAGVDALLGQQRRQLAQQFLRHAGLDLDLREPGGGLRAAAAHVGDAPILPAPGPGCRQSRLAVGLVAQRGRQQCSGGVPAEGLARPVVELGSHGGPAPPGRAPGRSAPFGQYWRSRPLMLLCQAACWHLAIWCVHVAWSACMARWTTSTRWRWRMRRAPRVPLAGW